MNFFCSVLLIIIIIIDINININNPYLNIYRNYYMKFIESYNGH